MCSMCFFSVIHVLFVLLFYFIFSLFLLVFLTLSFFVGVGYLALARIRALFHFRQQIAVNVIECGSQWYS